MTFRVEVGFRYDVRATGTQGFCGGRTIEVTELGSQIHYRYVKAVLNTDQRHARSAAEFHRAIREGVLTPVPVPVPVDPSLVPEVGESYKVISDAYKFSLDQMFVIQGVDNSAKEITYFYPETDAKCEVSMDIFARALRDDAIRLVRMTPLEQPKIPVSAPSIPNPFFVAEDELFKSEPVKPTTPNPTPTELARAYDRFTQTLKPFIGAQVSEELHRRILSLAYRELPKICIASLHTEGRRVMGVEVRIRGEQSRKSTFVPPMGVARRMCDEYARREQAAPSLVSLDFAKLEARVLAGELMGGSGLDNIGLWQDMPRKAGESDDSYRKRLKDRIQGSSSQKKVLTAYDVKVSIDGKELKGISEGTLRVTKEQPQIAQIKVEKTMSRTRIVNVFLFDNTAGLKPEARLAGKFENVITGSNDTMLLAKLDFSEMLKEHNKKRAAIVNEDLLARVGKTTYLRPIELDDLDIKIQEVIQA